MHVDGSMNFLELLLYRAKGCLFDQQGHRNLASPFRALFLPTTPAGRSRNHRTLRCVIMTLSPETVRQVGVSVLNTTIRGVDQFELSWSQGS